MANRLSLIGSDNVLFPSRLLLRCASQAIVAMSALCPSGRFTSMRIQASCHSTVGRLQAGSAGDARDGSAVCRNAALFASISNAPIAGLSHIPGLAGGSAALIAQRDARDLQRRAMQQDRRRFSFPGSPPIAVWLSRPRSRGLASGSSCSP
jgi:hypothetical protein